MKRLFRNDTWQLCYEQFLDSLASPETLRQYDLTIRRFFAFVSHKTPDKVTRTDIEAWLHQPATWGRNKGQPLSPYSRNAYRMTLQSFFNWCTTYLIEFRGKLAPILRTNPTRGMKIAKGAEVDREMSDEQIAAFFEVIPNTVCGLRDRALFRALLILGRRRQECTNLLRGDVERVVFREDGQSRPGWLYWFRGKFHRAKDDCAEIPEIVIEDLRAFHKAAGRDFDAMPADTPLFPGVTGPAKTNQPMNVNAVDLRFRKYARAAGLPDNLVVHSLRHASAWARYESNGRDAMKVRDDLRHASLVTTQRYLARRQKRQHGDPTVAALAAKFGNL